MSWQRDPAFEAVEWHGDPAASGYRYRAFVEGPDGEPAELVVYEDTPYNWCLGLPQTKYNYVAEGVERNLDAAKARVFKVWLAMRR